MQLNLDFEGGLTRRFPTFLSMLQAVAFNPTGPKAASIAADMDVRPSTLSQWLSGERNFPADRLDDFIDASGDIRPVHWLCEKYLPDDDTRRAETLRRLEALAAELPGLLREARG